MPKLARTIHFDQSDTQVFSRPAASGEWAIPGGFEFSNFSDGDLVGKARQAFSNGWLGLDSFGRATLVAVAMAEEAEIAAMTEALAAHFVAVYGAPSLEAAAQTAAAEIEFMGELCADHAPNTILSVSRELTEAGVKEQFSAIRAADAQLEQVAVHVSDD